jgi:general secretion pathway protein K
MKIPRKHKQRGIALVAVIIAIAIVLAITNEFGTATSTDLTAAANYRDQMKAHFLARSAQSMGELVVRIQQRLDNVKMLQGQFQITDYADTLIMPFCGSNAEVHDLLGPLADHIKGLGADVGTCGFDGPFKTDDDKINVNCANNNTAWQTIAAAITALIYFPAYDQVFDENDAEGWHRDRPTQVSAIIDYIDSDQQHLRDRGTSEDYQYETLKDHYYAKNNYIDTVGELHQVRGIDDRFWTLFGDAFTVYGGCKLNVSLLSNTQLIAAILYLSAANPNDPVIQDPKRLYMLASYIAKSRDFGEIFTNLDDFIAFVKNPGASVSTLASSGQGTMQGSAAASAVSAGLPGLSQNIGLVLDKGKLSQIATIGPRRTYRITAYGEITGPQVDKDGKPIFPPIRATVTGVWDTKVVPQNVRRPPVPKGAWVYEKEE